MTDPDGGDAGHDFHCRSMDSIDLNANEITLNDVFVDHGEECDDVPQNAPECRGPAQNLMFWATGATGRVLTPGQAFVLLRNPLVR